MADNERMQEVRLHPRKHAPGQRHRRKEITPLRMPVPTQSGLRHGFDKKNPVPQWRQLVTILVVRRRFIQCARQPVNRYG